MGDNVQGIHYGRHPTTSVGRASWTLQIDFTTAEDRAGRVGSLRRIYSDLESAIKWLLYPEAIEMNG
jgi:hypothetical protein